MTAVDELDCITPAVSEAKLFAGRYVRKVGQYGVVAVLGYLHSDGVEVIAEPKRLFPKNGVVETQGLVDHASLAPGDWVEFDVVKNTRFRAPGFKARHVKRLPRFAVLPELSIPAYRVLLTGEGWRGDPRPGLWAFRLTGDTVIVVELEAGKDRRLRVSRNSARDVKCYRFREESVVRLSTGTASDEVFRVQGGGELASFDWSDEADHIARVVRSLAGVNDPRFAEIIIWLDLHREEGTGRVSAMSGDKEPALEALRSGDLADRLRVDRELMETYLAAALENDAVRHAVAEYATEAYVARSNKLWAELADYIAAEKIKQLENLSAEMAAERTAAAAHVNEELEQHEAAGKAAEAKRLEDTRRDTTERMKALESASIARTEEIENSLGERRQELEQALAEQARELEEVRAKLTATEADWKGLLGEVEDARARLTDVNSEIDRALAIAARLGPAEQAVEAPAVAARIGGIVRSFPKHRWSARP